MKGTKKRIYNKYWGTLLLKARLTNSLPKKEIYELLAFKRKQLEDDTPLTEVGYSRMVSDSEPVYEKPLSVGHEDEEYRYSRMIGNNPRVKKKIYNYTLH